MKKLKKPAPKKVAAKNAAPKQIAKKPTPRKVAARRKAAAPVKKASKVNRDVRKQKSTVTRLVKRRTAKKIAPGRDRRRAREQKTKPTPAPRKPVARSIPAPKTPRPAAPPKAINVAEQGRGRGVSKADQSLGTYRMHRISGTARKGEWAIEVIPAGLTSEPKLIFNRSGEPFARVEKAREAAKTLYPNMTEVASAAFPDVSQAVAEGRLAQKPLVTALVDAAVAGVQRAVERSRGGLIDATPSGGLLDATPSATGEPPVETAADADADASADDLELVEFPGDGSRARRYTPPSITGDPPIDL